MVKRKLQWKIVLFICIIAVCLVIPVGLLLNLNIENYHYNQFLRGIEKGFETYDPSVNENAGAYEIYMDMSELYAGLFNIYGENKSYTIADIYDNTVYSSDFNYSNRDENRFINNLYLSSNFVKAATGGIGDDKKLMTLGGKTFYDYAVKKSGIVFYFRYYKQDWQNMVSQFNNIVFTALVISLFAAFVFGLLIAKAVTTPIEDITKKTQDISQGNFGQVVDRKGSDEIGQLANSINYMSRSLKDMLDEIKNEKSKVDIILNSMTDGIIAFDKEGNVIHANPEVKTMLNRIQLDGTLSDFIRTYRINATAGEIMNDPDTVNARKLSLKRGGMIMRLGFAVFRDEQMKNEGCMIILRDITEQQKMDIMQKEFVANVSHELKTPLTAIKSYAETLLSGKVEDKKVESEFLEVIEAEVDRMAELVKDLLQLSALDMKRTKLEFRKYSIRELVEKTVGKVSMTAKEKDQSIELDIRYPGKAVIDFEKMQRVLINLVSNSIKYTEPGGTIRVGAYKNESDIIITIEDNGIGIPARDLPRIFDRFYRVDKGRSRKMGGTGLGLAIAKEIVTAHSGNIRISSKLDEGTKVTIEFPVNSRWGTDDE